MLKAAGFKPSFRPAGKAACWPQFRSAEPSWLPWHINQTEAGQLLADLPRLTAFCRLFEEHPEIFAGCAPAEIPFAPATLPDRALMPQDLEWRPLLPPPAAGLDPFWPTAEQLEKLHTLKHQPGLVFEFDSRLLPGGSFLEHGSP